MRVAAYGGSRLAETSAAYADAEDLGKELALHGHTVMTGGYTGTMEAVSRGAASAGGHVIGVTCIEIERSHHRKVNPWVVEEWGNNTLLERLQRLVMDSDAALALPGGAGTLTEVALMWNLMIVKAIRPQPLILVGPAWQEVWDSMYGQLGDYIPMAQRQLLGFAVNCRVAVEMLQTTI